MYPEPEQKLCGIEKTAGHIYILRSHLQRHASKQTSEFRLFFISNAFVCWMVTHQEHRHKEQYKKSWKQTFATDNFIRLQTKNVTWKQTDWNAEWFLHFLHQTHTKTFTCIFFSTIPAHSVCLFWCVSTSEYVEHTRSESSRAFCFDFDLYVVTFCYMFYLAWAPICANWQIDIFTPPYFIWI